MYGGNELVKAVAKYLSERYYANTSEQKQEKCENSCENSS